MKHALQRAWLGRTWLACLLWPLSQLYRLLVAWRYGLYQAGFFKPTRLSVPVLVVGNVVVGGAGKTPLVMALVAHFEQNGIKVGVVSRGYGRAAKGCLEVLAHTPAALAGDEPALIQRTTNVPVFVAQKRVQAAKALLTAHPRTQLVVCDDGLQHYRLARDIEVVVFDNRGVANGWLLPAGPLRQPWPQLQRSGRRLVLHTGNSPAFSGFTSTRRLASYALDAAGHRVQLQSLKGKAIVALAAIAQPDAFFDMLTAQGLVLAQTIGLPDHYDFANYALRVDDSYTVLCTQKDAIKLFCLPSMAAVRLLAVPLQFSPEPAFFQSVSALLNPLLFGQTPS